MRWGKDRVKGKPNIERMRRRGICLKIPIGRGLLIADGSLRLTENWAGRKGGGENPRDSEWGDLFQQPCISVSISSSYFALPLLRNKWSAGGWLDLGMDVRAGGKARWGEGEGKRITGFPQRLLQKVRSSLQTAIKFGYRSRAGLFLCSLFFQNRGVRSVF